MTYFASGLRRHIARSVFPVCAAIAIVGLAAAADQAADVVARLGTSDITVGQLRGFVQALDPSVRTQASNDPQIMNRLVRMEIARMAVLSEAKAKNWDQRPDVAAAIARARDQAIVGSYLASITAPPADFPSDAEIQSAYDLNRDSFMVPRQYRLEQIFVALPSGSDKNAEAAAQKRIADLAAKAKAKSANFEDLARANSDHKESAARGGDMGWTAEAQIIPEIRSQIAGMNKGEVSDPIRSTAGWHIVRMMDTKPAAPRPLADVKATIVASLRQRKAQENEQAYLASLLEKTPISVNEIGLQKVFQTAQ